MALFKLHIFYWNEHSNINSLIKLFILNLYTLSCQVVCQYCILHFLFFNFESLIRFTYAQAYLEIR